MTKHYKSYGNAMFAGAGKCVNGTDMTDSVGKRGGYGVIVLRWVIYHVFRAFCGVHGGM